MIIAVITLPDGYWTSSWTGVGYLTYN